MDLILGHNQFLGISHISEEQGREKKEKFSDVKNIYKIVETASEIGYKGMILETHPHMLEFLRYYRENETFKMDFYLQLPHIQGYIQKMNEKGVYGTILDIMKNGGMKTVSNTIVKNLTNITKKDYISVAISLLKFEIAPFKDMTFKALLLHNVVTDLLLSLQVSRAFQEYCFFVEDTLNIEPGFITLNFDLFTKSIKEWDIKPHMVMTPINPGGYDMIPSKEKVENAINQYRGDIIAMNILGGGAFTVVDSYKYLKTFKNIKLCTIGASSENHLRELIKIFCG